MQKKIKLSALIPTYNREKTIGRAIDSALCQAYPLSEVIIIDDGSTDTTRKVIESYGKDVRYVYQQNKGVSGARNRGIREANCEWVAFLDSDDYWLPEHIKRIVDGIEATEGKANLYFSDTWYEKENCRHWELSEFRIKGQFELRDDGAEWALMPIQPMILPASVIKRSAYLEVGGLPEKMLTREDTLLFILLCLLRPVCAIEGCGTVVTSDGETRLTHLYDGNSLTFWQETVVLYKEALARVYPIHRHHKMHLIGLLSSSFFSLGRIYFRRKKLLHSIENLMLSCKTSPASFIKECFCSMSRQICKK